jgi:hypothetical protein
VYIFTLFAVQYLPNCNESPLSKLSMSSDMPIVKIIFGYIAILAGIASIATSMAFSAFQGLPLAYCITAGCVLGVPLILLGSRLVTIGMAFGQVSDEVAIAHNQIGALKFIVAVVFGLVVMSPILLLIALKSMGVIPADTSLDGIVATGYILLLLLFGKFLQPIYTAWDRALMGYFGPKYIPKSIEDKL